MHEPDGPDLAGNLPTWLVPRASGKASARPGRRLRHRLTRLPQAKQQEILGKLTAAMQRIGSGRRNVARLGATKKGLMQDFLTGRLQVKEV